MKLHLLITLALQMQAAPLAVVVLNAERAQQEHIPDGWQVKVNRGVPDISIVHATDGSSVRLKSRNSSFALERGLDIDVERVPYLSWSWKVTELPRGGDFRHSATDDGAAQVLVAFSDRRILTYIWDSNAPKEIMQNIKSVRGPRDSHVWFHQKHPVKPPVALRN